MSAAPLLEVLDLRTHFFTEDGVVRAVDGVSFSIGRGEAMALVGESGCGKTVTALSILRLVDPPGRIVGGRVLLEGRDLLGLSEREMREVRGGRIAMVFQEPMSSLNPVLTVGAQVVEAIRAHRRVSRREARDRAIDLLRKVRIPDPARRFGDHPHRLSGGLRQRVTIAMALACGPSLLIADEPTTALDVTIQAEILDLLRDLRAESDMSVLLITHNLPLAAGLAGRIAVMYASRVVEAGRTEEVLADPLHPYTRGLLASLPGIGGRRGGKLAAIPGSVPDPLAFPAGCRFHPRCPLAEEVCRSREPAAVDGLDRGHAASCHFPGVPPRRAP